MTILYTKEKIARSNKGMSKHSSDGGSVIVVRGEEKVSCSERIPHFVDLYRPFQNLTIHFKPYYNSTL